MKCPDPVRIWKVMLKARPIVGRNITSWSITANNDDAAFEAILTSTNVLLCSTTEPSFSEINTLIAYQYYIFNTLTCEGPNAGIQATQLYRAYSWCSKLKKTRSVMEVVTFYV